MNTNKTVLWQVNEFGVAVNKYRIIYSFIKGDLTTAMQKNSITDPTSPITETIPETTFYEEEIPEEYSMMETYEEAIAAQGNGEGGGEATTTTAAAGTVAMAMSIPEMAAQVAAAAPPPSLPTPQPIPAKPVPVPIPPKPIPIPKKPILLRNRVSGRYRGRTGPFELELRIDVDGRRPTMRVSGDFYQISGSTTLYFGSFVVHPIAVRRTISTVTIEGTGTYTWSAGAPKVKITIPRTPIFRPRADAVLQFYRLDDTPGASYTCSFESVYFRTVLIETDCVENVTPFSSYNTGSLPSGGPARNLSVVSSYAEAGLEFQVSGSANVIPLGEAQGNAKWSDSELHASMAAHFSQWKEEPQWKVWLLAANEHEEGPGLYGIMFDYPNFGRQRQGCATFHNGIGGNTADKLRLQLYTYVHELGHCFNLLHSWQKSYANPPVPNRPNALSFMNYPWRYPSGGASGFWSAFAFQFDDEEVVHLRHAFRNSVIMGGNDFVVGSALTALEDPAAFSTPVSDESGLQLELRTQDSRQSFAMGEPVVVELKLSATDTRGKRAHTLLHPNSGSVQVAIRKPSGHVQIFKPLAQHCAIPQVVTLNEKYPSIYDSAYIGYGKDGFYFDQQGTYLIRAVYSALDGSQVTSNILTVRVRSSQSAEDDQVAELLMGQEQGILLSLLGSDSQMLKSGNEALATVVKEHGKHPLAVYAKLVQGYNEARNFKTVLSDNSLSVRKPNPERAAELLTPVIEDSARGAGVDNITLNQTMRQLAVGQKAAGREKQAENTIERMLKLFAGKNLRPHVMQTIELQAKSVLGGTR